MNPLSVGNQAPAFTLLNQQEKFVSLSDFRGKKVLIYFIQRLSLQAVPHKPADCVTVNPN
ncbi:thioredoxin-dependent thiol peroxidase [Haemophilus influenzae 22.4-21]|uniref:Thioredoxin-dependent thiol peroxidase n=1 Tax=Haemophilus influenzae 22.4-21 TaxID=375063 RepID=A4NVH6_HAEIF|nr:thioredoxin-dependent thiol peroxidase [Haemophilus influenzae 22.4-21]